MPTKSRSRSATAGFAAALLLFVVGSLVAWWQPPRLFPLKPQTTADWWLQPLEDNAFRRMPRIGETLHDVFVVPTTGEVWAVGDKGLIVHSRDDGRTWEHVMTGFDKPSSTGQFESSASDLTEQQEAIQEEKNAINQKLLLLMSKRDAEIKGTSESLTQGYGPIARAITNDISEIERQITDLNIKLNDLKNDAANHESRTPKNLAAIFFIADGQYGWIVGHGGLILATADGGTTWNPQTSPSKVNLYDVTFAADGSHGWAVGVDGTILTTTDGGKSWNPQTCPSKKTLHGIAFTADGLRGWAVGNYGTILATADGGITWNLQTSPRSLSDLELYDSFPSSKRLKNDCYALIRPFIGRFSTLMRLFLPFGQSYPASTWSRFKL